MGLTEDTKDIGWIQCSQCGWGCQFHRSEKEMLPKMIEECFNWRYELGSEFQTGSKIIFTNKEPIYLEIVKLPNSNYSHYGTIEIKYGDLGIIQQRSIINNDNETIYIKLQNNNIVFMSYKLPKIKLIT